MCSRSKSVVSRAEAARPAVSVEPLEGRRLMTAIVYSVNIVGLTSPTAPAPSRFFDINTELSGQRAPAGNLTALGGGGGTLGY